MIDLNTATDEKLDQASELKRHDFEIGHYRFLVQ